MNTSITDVTITSDGYLGTLCAAGQVRVESVHHSLGQSPGIALLSLPKMRPHEIAGELAYRPVTIRAFDGTIIFYGHTWELRYSELGDDSQIDIIACDSRVGLNVNAIGDPRETTQWGLIGWNVVFNKDNKPNMINGEFAFNNPSATYWTINDIIEYIGRKYVSPSTFTNAGWTNNAFSDAVGSSVNPGEIDLSGESIASALDQMVSRLGRASWSINYSSNKIYMVSLDSLGTSRTIYYATGNNVNSWATSNDWNVSIDAKRGRNKYYTISGNLEAEYTFTSKNGRLAIDSSWESGIYAVKYTIPTTSDVGPYGIEWVPSLVTRRNSDGDGYLSATDYAAYPENGSEVVDRECIWIEDEGVWKRLLSGFDIAYNPPAIYLENTLVVADEDNTEHEISLTDPTAYEIAITVSVRVNSNIAGEAEYSWGENKVVDLAAYSEVKDLRPLARVNSSLPDLSDDDPTAMVSSGIGYYFDPQTELNSIADARLGSYMLVHRELVASLPIPQHFNLGDQILFTPTGGGTSVLIDTIICTGVDHYFNAEQKTVVRGENQLGSAQDGMAPLSSRDIGQWRYEARMNQLKIQAESNQKLQAEQREEAAKMLANNWKDVKSQWSKAGEDDGEPAITPDEYVGTYGRMGAAWVNNPPTWEIKDDEDE